MTEPMNLLMSGDIGQMIRIMAIKYNIMRKTLLFTFAVRP